MAIIGLYDADMSNYIDTPFNLDLMKISSYYKKNNHIVVLNPNLDIDKYTKLVYRKDYYDGVFDGEILLNNKTIYGGRAFSQDKYIMLPPEVESLRPDRYIYDNFEKIFCYNRKNEILFKRMMRAQHVRLSLDGKNIWDNWTSQLDPNIRTRTFIFHDYNLGDIKDSLEIVQDIYKNLPGFEKRYIGTKFPIQISDADALLGWAKFFPMAHFYTIQYNGMIEDSVIQSFYYIQKGTSIARQFIYNITDAFDSIQDFVLALPKLYRQIVYLRSKRIKILLKYNADFFEDKMWIAVLDLISKYSWQCGYVTREEFDNYLSEYSMFDYVYRLSEHSDFRFFYPGLKVTAFTKEMAREIFSFVRENCYELFKDFYECHKVELKGGKFTYA